LSVTGNTVLGVRSSDIGLSFAGGANKLSVASSGNKVAQVGTVSRHDRNATLTKGI
jgi:hypothetical protein